MRENVLHHETSSASFDLTGRSALVIGGGNGIGTAICEELLRAGATVLVADIAEAAALRVTERLPRARAVIMDASSLTSIRSVAGVEGLDILTNNAGVSLVCLRERFAHYASLAVHDARARRPDLLAAPTLCHGSLASSGDLTP